MLEFKENSIHDAIEAGFNKIVFIIRKDIKDAFKEAIGDRIEKICKDLDVEIAYAYQELSELPDGVELPAGRTKPWGTGQAVLACKEVLHEPFAVINILLQKRLRDLQIMLLKILLRKKERLQSVLIPVSNPMYLPK